MSIARPTFLKQQNTINQHPLGSLAKGKLDYFVGCKKPNVDQLIPDDLVNQEIDEVYIKPGYIKNPAFDKKLRSRSMNYQELVSLTS